MQLSAEDLASFAQELQKETDRILPLEAAALIDEFSLDTLHGFVVRNNEHD